MGSNGRRRCGQRQRRRRQETLYVLDFFGRRRRRLRCRRRHCRRSSSRRRCLFSFFGLQVVRGHLLLLLKFSSVCQLVLEMSANVRIEGGAIVALEAANGACGRLRRRAEVWLHYVMAVGMSMDGLRS